MFFWHQCVRRRRFFSSDLKDVEAPIKRVIGLIHTMTASGEGVARLVNFYRTSCFVAANCAVEVTG